MDYNKLQNKKITAFSGCRVVLYTSTHHRQAFPARKARRLLNEDQIRLKYKECVMRTEYVGITLPHF